MFLYYVRLVLIKQLKAAQFDLIIDLHKNLRTFLIKSILNVPSLTYKKETIRKFLLTRFGLNTMLKKHIVVRNIETLVSLGVINDGRGMDYFIAKDDEIPLDHLPVTHQFGYIALVIGGSYYTKKLTIPQLQKLCQLIEFPILLLGGKEDREAGVEVASVDSIKIFNACGRYSLNQSAFLVKKSKLVISHDTGLQYIASAFEKRTIAIWGGTSPALDVEPYFAKSHAEHMKEPMYRNVIVDGLSCQPCSNFGTKTCPKKHFNCMMKHDLEGIAMLANKWVAIN